MIKDISNNEYQNTKAISHSLLVQIRKEGVYPAFLNSCFNENRVEAIEFTVPKGSPVAGKQLLELSIKPNIIIACITHNGNVVIPNGQSVIQEGDSVILVTTNKGLSDIKDILR